MPIILFVVIFSLRNMKPRIEPITTENSRIGVM